MTRLAPAPVAVPVAVSVPVPGRPLRPVPAAARHGRRVQPRARRASGASGIGVAVLARSARLVAVRALGTSVAAAAVTLALAERAAEPGPRAAVLASLSVRGLAAAAILCAAWGFQDRARLGPLATGRAWYGTAVVLALVHAAWFEATLPGTWAAHLGTTVATFGLDVVLVAAPALLGARAGRPDAA